LQTTEARSIEDLKAWADLGAKQSTSDPGRGTVLPAKRVIAVSPAFSTARGADQSGAAAMSAGETFRSDRDRFGLFRALSDNNCPRDGRALIVTANRMVPCRKRSRDLHSDRGGAPCSSCCPTGRLRTASLRRSGLHDHRPALHRPRDPSDRAHAFWLGQRTCHARHRGTIQGGMVAE